MNATSALFLEQQGMVRRGGELACDDVRPGFSPMSVKGEALKVRREQGWSIKDWSCRRTMNSGSWPRHGPFVFVSDVDQRGSLTLSSGTHTVFDAADAAV